MSENDWVKEWLKEAVEKASYFPSEEDWYEDQQTSTKTAEHDSVSFFESLGRPKVYCGEALEKAVDNVMDERRPYIEGFIYHHSVTQFFADDGVGKSTVVLNAMLQASSGQAVFNSFRVPEPCRIVWLCAERPLEEPFERIKMMKDAIRPNFRNLVFDKEIQTMDLMRNGGAGLLYTRLSELVSELPGGGVDIVVIDPIYGLVGDLSDPVDVGVVNRVIRQIQNMYECAVIYTHHSNRGQMFEGKRHEGDMYGNRFLSANLTGLFHIKRTEDGVELLKKKDTYSNLISHIPLVFDEITSTLSVEGGDNYLNKRDKILIFLRKKYSEKKEFALREIANQLKVSDAYIRKTINPMIKNGSIINKATQGTKGIYYVEKNI